MSTTDPFAEAARAEILSRLGHEAQRLDGGKRVTAFVGGAEWAASREYTDAEVEAAMHFLAHFRYAPWWGGSEFRDAAHALLSDLRAARGQA